MRTEMREFALLDLADGLQNKTPKCSKEECLFLCNWDYGDFRCLRCGVRARNNIQSQELSGRTLPFRPIFCALLCWRQVILKYRDTGIRRLHRAFDDG